MIKGYQEELMNIYEKIRNEEENAFKNRKEEIKKLYPEIIAVDNKIGNLCIKLSLNALKKSSNREEEFYKLQEAITDLRMKKCEMLVSKGYTPDYLNLHYRCKKCKDTGYIGVKQCSCYRQKLVQLYYKNSDLEDAVRANNFKTFDINYYTSHKIGDEKFSPRRNMETILDKIVNDYIPNFKNHNNNLLFYGNSGTGKTFLSHCIAKALLDNGFLVVYRTSDELIRNLKEIRFQGNEFLEDLLVNCDLLIIDDLGAEQITEFSITELFTLLNKKILKNKKMLISTNLTLPSLSKTYSERITSRLLGNFTLYKFYAEDIRVKKNLSKLK